MPSTYLRAWKRVSSSKALRAMGLLARHHHGQARQARRRDQTHQYSRTLQRGTAHRCDRYLRGLLPLRSLGNVSTPPSAH